MQGPTFLFKSVKITQMERFTKPYLTVEQQLEKVQGRGLVVNDRDYAIHSLKNIGYYRLSGYWYPARKNQIIANPNGKDIVIKLDEFNNGTTFSSIIDIYSYDKKLRMLFLEVLEIIESAIKTDIALHLGKYDPWAYRDISYFNNYFTDVPEDGISKHQEFIDKFDDAVEKSKYDFVIHFREKYSDPLPIWAAVELWDFGTTAHVLNGLNNVDKMSISSKYNLPKPNILPSWIMSLNYIRNVCAHHSRLWNKPPVTQPSIPAEVDLLEHLVGNRYAQQRVYATMAVARYLQMIIAPDMEWSSELISLNESFPEFRGVHFKSTGFPDDWENLELWR